MAIPFDQTNIGHLIATKVAIIPQAPVAGTVDGAAIDRNGFNSAVLMVQTGAVTGAPTAQSASFQIEESADGLAGWTAVTGAVLAVTAVDSTSYLDINLGRYLRYIRVAATTSFTAGTAPTFFQSAAVILGGAKDKPAA